MFSSSDALGGYFGLEMPAEMPLLYPHAHMFQSARAAFVALLRIGQPKRVWVPRYICNSMLVPLMNTGTEYKFYAIDKNLSLNQDIDLGPKDWLLYVNYFGVCATNVDVLLSRYDPNKIILDHSHAYYSPPRECLATLYSPRKFFGIPDGGLLITNIPIEGPAKIDSGSITRTVHLLKRHADNAEAGYADYKQAEESLVDCEPKQISSLTKRMLQSVDSDGARRRRNDNFRYLHENLYRFNLLPIELSTVNGPLCYPLVSNISALRKRLIDERIFVATYWPDVLTRCAPSDYEAMLAQNLIALPCDQRYREEHLFRVVKICLEYFAK